MATSKYYGITIGPVTRVLSSAKSTAGIWAASYFFSWLAKAIVGRLYHDRRFLKPSLADADFSTTDMIGRFPDQYIFAAAKGDTIAAIRSGIDEAIGSRAYELAAVLHADPGEVNDYLHHALRVTLCETDIDGTDINVVDRMQQVMSILDCRDAFVTRLDDGHDFLARVFNMKMGDLRRLYFPGADGNADIKRGFTSLRNIDDNKPYVAFVSLDGDNFGRNNEVIKSSLGSFNSALNKKVHDYGGQVIFQGGDDITFYAPLTDGSRICDIFSLLHDIDPLFNTIVLDRAPEAEWANGEAPSLSYGVAISYSKHPMSETLRKADEMLEKAKAIPGKNAICWEMRKHSGQTAGGSIRKSDDRLWNNMISLITGAIAAKPGSDDDSDFLHSVTHGIVAYKELLCNIIGTPDAPALLDNFFHNVYGDNYGRHRRQLDAAKTILGDSALASYASSKDIYPLSAIEWLHNILRYIELLIRKEDKA